MVQPEGDKDIVFHIASKGWFGREELSRESRKDGIHVAVVLINVAEFGGRAQISHPFNLWNWVLSCMARAKLKRLLTMLCAVSLALPKMSWRDMPVLWLIKSMIVLSEEA